MFGACVMRLRGPSCGWGAVVVSAAVVFLVAALGLALVLILTREFTTTLFWLVLLCPTLPADLFLNLC